MRSLPPSLPPSQDNEIDRLPRDFGEIGEELHLLAMRGNQLEKLPKCISGCSGLKSVDLSRNRIAEIEAFSLPALADLNLANNQLAALPDCWADVRSLAKLNVSGNQLTTLPPSLGRMAGLKVLIAEENQLSSLPELGGSRKLSSLQLAKNSLANCPTLSTCASLQELDLTQNGLSALPQLPPEGGMVKLLVSSNALPEIDGAVLFGMVRWCFGERGERKTLRRVKREALTPPPNSLHSLSLCPASHSPK